MWSEQYGKTGVRKHSHLRIKLCRSSRKQLMTTKKSFPVSLYETARKPYPFHLARKPYPNNKFVINSTRIHGSLFKHCFDVMGSSRQSLEMILGTSNAYVYVKQLKTCMARKLYSVFGAFISFTSNFVTCIPMQVQHVACSYWYRNDQKTVRQHIGYAPFQTKAQSRRKIIKYLISIVVAAIVS